MGKLSTIVLSELSLSSDFRITLFSSLLFSSLHLLLSFVLIFLFFVYLFTLFKKDINNYVKIIPLKIWYQFIFSDLSKFNYSNNHEQNLKEISKFNSDDIKGFKKSHQEGFIVVEFKNVQGNAGSCSDGSGCEWIAFQFENCFWIVRKEELLTYCRKNVAIEYVNDFENCYKKLYSRKRKIKTHNLAIADFTGIMLLFASGTHLNNGDSCLLSTLSLKDKEKWQSLLRHLWQQN